MVTCSCNEQVTYTPNNDAALKQEALPLEEYVIKLDSSLASQIEDLPQGQIPQAFLQHGIINLERVFPESARWESRHRKAGLHTYYRVQTDPYLPVTKVEDYLTGIDGVLGAEPVRKKVVVEFFNDPFLPRQWNLINNQDQYAGINVQKVWQEFTSGKPNVIVSVVDGGIQLDHPDLDGVVVPVGPEGSRSFIPGQRDYEISPFDHGTHVAGIIGAKNNNGTGVSSIAGGSGGSGGVKLLSCAIFMKNPSTGQTVSGNTAEAIVWGADHGAVISQNSWTYGFESLEEAKGATISLDDKAAIDYFIQYAGCDEDGNQLPDSPMKGGVVIFGAGNNAWQYALPAQYEPVIAVGAYSGRKGRSYYSNFGDWVDICAPGGDSSVDDMILSTITGGTYAYKQGTSMACPHVSGVAALLVSYFGGPGFTNQMLKTRLLEGATHDARLTGAAIGPALDAYGSFNLFTGDAPDVVSGVTVRPKANSLEFEFTASVDTDDKSGVAHEYIVLASTCQSDFDNFNPRDIPSTVSYCRVSGLGTAVGDILHARLNDLAFETSYYTSVVASDKYGNYSACSFPQRVSTLGNAAPEVSTDFSGECEIMSHQSISIDFSISDPDGHLFDVDYVPASKAEKLISKDSGAYTLQLCAVGVQPGTYTAVFNIADRVEQVYRKITKFEVKYTIVPNRRPVLLRHIDNVHFTNPAQLQELVKAEYFSDPDSEELSYMITQQNPSFISITELSESIVLAPLNYGMDIISLRATDANGLYAETSFKVSYTDPSKTLDVYPKQVKRFLNISSSKEESLSVQIYSSASKLLYSCSRSVSVFEPIVIDMSDFVLGTYMVYVKSESQTLKEQVIKL